MLDFFTAAFGDSLFAASPWVVLARIIAAALLGGAVAWIHSRTVGSEPGTGFAMQSTLVLLSALIGLALGAFNGVMVWLVGIPSIVVTLGTLSIYRGLAFVASSGWVRIA